MKKTKNGNGNNRYEIPEIMTVEEVAAYLRIHQTTVYRLANADAIPHFRIGGSHRFSRAAIQRWLDKQEASNLRGM